MAKRFELLLLGLANTTSATGIAYGVVTGRIAPGWIFLAAVAAFLAIVDAVRIGISTQQSKSG